MIHRHNFTDNFKQDLIAFGKKNKELYVEDFKIKWKEWKEIHKKKVKIETDLLIKNGYKGDIEKKMYHAVRYYFKKKSITKKKAKERKQYIGTDRQTLVLIDRHIQTIDKNMKPQIAYNNFVEIHSDKNDNEYLQKLKKTYKNRLYYYRNH